MRSPWPSEDLLEVENHHFQFLVENWKLQFWPPEDFEGQGDCVQLPRLSENPPGVTLLLLHFFLKSEVKMGWWCN